MKILLSRSASQQFIGGAELSARDITRCLTKQGHDCVLITNIRREDMKKGLNAGTLRYSLWPRRNSSVLDKLLYFPRLLALFVHYFFITIFFKPDVICPQSREDQVVLTFIGKILGIPVVWRDPGDLALQLSHTPVSILQKLNRRLLMKSIKNSTAIFTLNEDDKAVLEKTIPTLGDSHISVIASDILFEDYRITKPDTKNQSSDIVIGTISQLHPHKGVEFLIRAFKELSKKHPGIELQVVSNGPEKETLQELAGSSRVTFLGHLSNISDWLSRIDIYAQPSLREGWGRTVKEARYFGKPIVASKVGGIVKQISDGKTGLLVEPGTVDELKAALERLLRDPALQKRLAAAARKDALHEGDWNKTVSDKIVPLFKSVLQQR